MPGCIHGCILPAAREKRRTGTYGSGDAAFWRALHFITTLFLGRLLGFHRQLFDMARCGAVCAYFETALYAALLAKQWRRVAAGLAMRDILVHAYGALLTPFYRLISRMARLPRLPYCLVARTRQTRDWLPPPGTAPPILLYGRYSSLRCARIPNADHQ